MREKNASNAVLEKFPLKKIVVVGDLVADQFLRGTIARVSREAPVFILRHDETETLPGAAANAAANVAALGGRVAIVGAVGTDADGKILVEKLRAAAVDCDSVVAADSVRTTTKVRVLAGQQYAPRQQVIRIDYESKTAAGDEIQNRLAENFMRAAADADAVIISDYSYGAASGAVVDAARRLCAEKQIPLLVDSRFNLESFRGATTATPNQDEVEQILGENFNEVDCENLCLRLNFQALLVTRGNKGMWLIEPDKPVQSFDAVGAKEPIDVTGAGDTVIATYALGLASDLSFFDAARLANHAGGIVVMKKGTATVSAEELVASL